MKTIYLSLKEEAGPSIFKSYNISQWFYFSPDYLNFNLLKENCPSAAKYSDIGEILQEKAQALKKSYIEVIGRLNARYSRKYPLAWWTSMVAERNEMSTHTFLTVCYYNIFYDIYENDNFQDRSLIVVESISLFLLIIKRLRNKYNVITLGRPYFLTWTFFRPKVATVYRIIKFVSWIFSGKLKQVSNPSSSPDTSKIFIRTWISDKTISSDGALHDVYFPGLYEYLEREGYKIVIIPNFYNLTLSSKEIQKRINKCKYQFFIPKNYLTWKDYFKILIILIYQAVTSRFNNVEHSGNDVSKILTETQRAGIFFSYTYIYIAQAFALRNLSKTDFMIKSFIYTFENMSPEKPLSYAVKEYFPGVKSIGFQHSVLYPLQTCLYPATQEWKDMPLPDKIVCSGKLFLDIYLKHGAHRERLVLGPALRFNNLISKCENDHMDFSLKVFEKNKILIVFPLAEADALELAIKSSEAIKLLVEVKMLKIGLRPHPMMSVDKLNIIESFFNDVQCDVGIIDRPMDEVLTEYSLLITMASGVIFDGMIEGLPVIRVGRSHSLNFDPADFIENNSYDFKAQTIEQLKELICKLLVMNDEERLGVLNYGRQFVKESFTPVNEDTLKSFISTS
jgi:hypothetical protein